MAKMEIPADSRPMQGVQHIHRRPGPVTLLAVLQFVFASLCLLAALVVGTVLFSDTARLGSFLTGGILLGAFGTLQMVCGIGLWKLKSYGRTIQLVFAWIGLLGFPVGTIISILILVYMRKPGVKILFSGKTAPQLTAEEAAQVAAVTQGSTGTALAIGALVLVAILVIGIVAAVAIPGFLRARTARTVANELSAIASLGAINTAQARYSEKCHGYAPNLLELKHAGDFLSPDLTGAATVTTSGYNVTVEPSGTAGLVPNPPLGCTGTVTEYFAKADPVTPGRTGMRYFATDMRGTVVFGTATIANPIGTTATPLR